MSVFLRRHLCLLNEQRLLKQRKQVFGRTLFWQQHKQAGADSSCITQEEPRRTFYDGQRHIITQNTDSFSPTCTEYHYWQLTESFKRELLVCHYDDRVRWHVAHSCIPRTAFTGNSSCKSYLPEVWSEKNKAWPVELHSTQSTETTRHTGVAGLWKPSKPDKHQHLRHVAEVDRNLLSLKLLADFPQAKMAQKYFSLWQKCLRLDAHSHLQKGITQQAILLCVCVLNVFYEVWRHRLALLCVS